MDMKLSEKRVQLPSGHQSWLEGGKQSISADIGAGEARETLQRTLAEEAIVWPRRKTIFITDPHADPHAFVDSLVASGTVKITGDRVTDFKLTGSGRNALFVIGGDCIDKGPSNLGLLRAVKHLLDLDARVRLLAGNHDIRLLLGMRMVGRTDDPRSGHFFVRLGHKVMPLLVELRDEYLTGKHAYADIPGEKACRRRLFPSDEWLEHFPKFSRGVTSERAIEREIKRLKKRMKRFEEARLAHGLTMRDIYAASLVWKELFLDPQGEFFWFYDSMRLAHRSGSFLYIHAGLNDQLAGLVGHKSAKRLNAQFRKQLSHAPFNFYFGPLAGGFRTKYREHDWALTKQGVRRLTERGVRVIVHGHLNHYHGQRIYLRDGIINIQCDSSMDRGTRRLEGLKGNGASVTVIQPRGRILGISNDYPYIKRLELPEKR